MPDEPDKVTLELEQHEALVLLEFLGRIHGDDQSVRIEHRAEASVLCDLCCMLEAQLVQPFCANHTETLEAARRQVLGPGGHEAG
ncbi:MAG: hypothetical protein HMLKMBBP_01640 [Planctomycetes bacterium]|nr:hypothetical protein [Planctomycetota bacterium]